MDSTYMEIGARSLLTGVVAGIAVKFVFNEVGSVPLPMLGNVSMPMAIGTTAALAKLTSELIVMYGLTSDQEISLRDMLGSAFELAMIAGSSLLVGYLLLPKYATNNMSALLKLAATAGISEIISDYTYDNYLEPFMTPAAELEF